MTNYIPPTQTSLKIIYNTKLTQYDDNCWWINNFSTQFFVSSHMYPENPEGTQVIVGSMNMGYISDTARNRTHNLFRPKREPIALGHRDGMIWNEELLYACDMLSATTYVQYRVASRCCMQSLYIPRRKIADSFESFLGSLPVSSIQVCCVEYITTV